MENAEWKVGAKILLRSRYWDQIVSIVRETPTTWVTSTKQTIDKKTLRLKGSYDKWDITLVSLATQADAERIQVNNLANLLKHITRDQWRQLPLATLKQIMALIPMDTLNNE